MLPALFIIATLLVMASAMIMVVRGFVVRLGSWAKAYHRLALRYGSKVSFSRNRPRLAFKYGDADCVLSNVGRNVTHTRTQLKIAWPDRKLKLFVSAFGEPVGIMKAWGLNLVEFESENGLPFVVYCNDANLARTIVNETTQWQIQQLMAHGGDSGIEIFVSSGQMKITKPGFIKHDLLLDDFVRFSLGLFDQFKLALNNDLQFVRESEAVVLSDIKCPICSEQIQLDLVTCVRCKTPHCADCWEYNGQCSTFACNETRFLRADGNQSQIASHS